MTSVHHIAVTTSNMRRAEQFYDSVLGPLDYQRGYTSSRLCTWLGDGPEFLVYEVEGGDISSHQFGRPGWHHTALAVQDRAVVESVYEAASVGGWTVVHKPREYPEYAEGYYAVFIEDPDGIRFEVAHIPSKTH